MNWNKLQEIQLALDNAILQAKPQMTAEERFNKTLCETSVAVARIYDCDNKGKVDEKRFKRVEYTGGKVVYEDWGKNAKKGSVTFEQAHKLTLVEEASDCLHFILSLANQLGIKFKKIENEEKSSLEDYFLKIQLEIAKLSQATIMINLDIEINSLFYMLIKYFELLGITTQELEQAYYEKNEENYRRLREGY